MPGTLVLPEQKRPRKLDAGLRVERPYLISPDQENSIGDERRCEITPTLTQKKMRMLPVFLKRVAGFVF